MIKNSDMDTQKNLSGQSGREYRTPALRTIPVVEEGNILSNTEPIVDDGQVHEWD